MKPARYDGGMRERLWEALSGVMDPEIRKPLTELGMVESITFERGTAHAHILLTIVGCPASDRIEREVREALLRVEDVEVAEVTLGVMSPAQREAFIQRVRGNRQKKRQFGPDSLTRVIAVTSGKGGVGKSSVTAQLAIELAARGLRVGVLDADIFGFSLPGLFGLTKNGVTAEPTRIDNMIIPPEAYGVGVISIGMFLGGEDPRNTAVSWRGPMLHRTLEQFLTDVWFGDLDFLLLDLPPGTGDVALSVGQLLPQSEVLVITTPQEAAADVAARSGILALQSGLRLLGVVENMSGLIQPDGSRVDMFGSGGGEAVAQRLLQHPLNSVDGVVKDAVEVLAQIPLSVEFRQSGDEGLPAPAHDPALREIQRLADRLQQRPDGLAGTPLPLQVT